ncbi:uncharacterized protein METZ01_LOCUS381416 [marine metagenome]|uniref:Uncharacterized protein n=1 Tax=marine metagenome TaxID=408172 RepID=A0A382U3L7_9ZZZZ
MQPLTVINAFVDDSIHPSISVLDRRCRGVGRQRRNLVWAPRFVDFQDDIWSGDTVTTA